MANVTLKIVKVQGGGYSVLAGRRVLGFGSMQVHWFRTIAAAKKAVRSAFRGFIEPSARWRTRGKV